MKHTLSHHVQQLQNVGMDVHQAQRVGAFVEDSRSDLVTKGDQQTFSDLISAKLDAHQSAMQAQLSKLQLRLTLLVLGGNALFTIVLKHLMAQ